MSGTRVALVSGPRGPEPMGLALAEQRLVQALPAAAEGLTLTRTRVVGGRAAHRHAHRIGGRWMPAVPGHATRAAWYRSDLVHLLGLDVPPPDRGHFVATVYDLSPLRYDDEGTLPPWFDEVVARAALLLTPSAFTASELLTLRGVSTERIRVFGLAPAVDARGSVPLSPGELADLGIRPPFVLRCGGYTQRKNLSLLLEAWRGVNDTDLVLVGPAPPARDRLLAKVGDARIVVLDYVSEVLLARLLRTATVLVSPSLYEGFGLPPLEAMAAGTPVVAVRTPFAEEVCGDAALLVAPEPDALREAVISVLTDTQRASELSTAGLARSATFTWRAAAERVTAAYREAVAV